MIEDLTLQTMLDEALAQVTKGKDATYKIVPSKKPGGPLTAFLNKPGKKACYMHNISRGLLAICGNGLPKIIEVIYENWEATGIEKVNVCNSVLDHRFRQRLTESGSDFNKQATKFILDRAKKLAHGNNPESVIAVDRALSLFKEETFSDEKSIGYLFDRSDNFRNVSAMIRRLSQHSFFAHDDLEQYPIYELNGGSKEAREQRASIGTKMGVDESIIKMLCELVVNHGTVRFIKRYVEFLEADRLKVQTLASDDDISTLAESMRLG